MPRPASTVRENRLATETSPYLLQHKANPVDWWPWGPDALAEAQRSGKPILLSVGYAACHWCHVMAHESFEDPEVAAVMNELFVNIKVDREERPDIDQIYMSALHLLGEQGGWPLTMFLTSGGEPVWGGTYFPKSARYGRPGFVDVLREIARLFREEHSRIDQNRRVLMARLAERARPPDKVIVGADELDALAGRVLDMMDAENGGLRGAPKFPQTSILELLWRAGLRTGHDRLLDIVELTLDRICQGGIFDHLGGGFARYSVDERWLVPHFEKMLYDNAQLVELLALAFARSGRPLYRQRANETVGWLIREMRTPEGAFCASLDAESEGQEGKFYVWSLREIEGILGPEDAVLFARSYDVTPGGNFEGHNILNRLHEPAGRSDHDPALEGRLTELRSKLFGVRSSRIRPGLDDKVLADWNGLMAAALTNAGIVFAEPAWIETAADAFAFVSQRMTRGDRLGHSWRADKLKFPGLASDYAMMIRAALALAEATGNGTYAERALAWQRTFDEHHADPQGFGYFMTADDAEGLVLRPQSTADEAIPNSNAVAIQNLVRLAALTGDHRWRLRADELLDPLLALASTNLFMHAGLLNALDFRLRHAEIVVSGAGTLARDLLAEALRLPFIERTVIRSEQGLLSADHPAHDRIAAAGDAAFVCAGETCSLPITQPGALGQVWRSLRDPKAGTRSAVS
jgi:uncharacterized protein YyaL (SSP411 family)